MALDPRVASHYDVTDEDARLWTPGFGELTRLRTWDIFARYLPGAGRLLDVGGGPGAHSAHLAGCGYDVTLVEPVAHHRAAAAERSASASTSEPPASASRSASASTSEPPASASRSASASTSEPPASASRSTSGPVAAGPAAFGVVAGDARALPAADGSIDVVLLMGPLYHLDDPADRRAALHEARRVLRPGGRLLVEAISRYAWVMDASVRDVLDSPGLFDNFTWNLQGYSQDPATSHRGGFWAYFHLPDELHDEVAGAGFADVELTAVEGWGRLLGDLDTRMANPAPLLRAIRLLEHEPSLLGVSAHIVATATAPAPAPGRRRR